MLPKSIEEYVGEKVINYLNERDLELNKYKDLYERANHNLLPWKANEQQYVCISFCSLKDTQLEEETQQFCKENDLNFIETNDILSKWDDRTNTKRFLKVIGSYPNFDVAVKQIQKQEEKGDMFVATVGEWVMF